MKKEKLNEPKDWWGARLRILAAPNDRFRASDADLPVGGNMIWWICMNCFFRTCYNIETKTVWRMRKIDSDTPCPDCGQIAWRTVKKDSIKWPDKNT
jgi:hypothetical protein